MPTFVQIKQMTWHQVTPSPFPMYTRLFKRFQQKKNREKSSKSYTFFFKIETLHKKLQCVCIFFKLKKGWCLEGLLIWNLNKPVKVWNAMSNALFLFLHERETGDISLDVSHWTKNIFSSNLNVCPSFTTTTAIAYNRTRICTQPRIVHRRLRDKLRSMVHWG